MRKTLYFLLFLLAAAVKIGSGLLAMEKRELTNEPISTERSLEILLRFYGSVTESDKGDLPLRLRRDFLRILLGGKEADFPGRLMRRSDVLRYFLALKKFQERYRCSEGSDCSQGSEDSFVSEPATAQAIVDSEISDLLRHLEFYWCDVSERWRADLHPEVRRAACVILTFFKSNPSHYSKVSSVEENAKKRRESYASLMEEFVASEKEHDMNWLKR